MAGSRRDHGVLAGVGGKGQAQRSDADLDAIAGHRGALGGARPDAHRQVGHALFDRHASLLHGGESWISRGEHVDGLSPVLPGVRDAADVLLAVGEVDERARGGIQPLALGKLGAGDVVAPALDGVASCEEERLGRGGIVRVGAGKATGADRHQEHSATNRAKPRFGHRRRPNISTVGAEVGFGAGLGVAS